MSIRPRNIDRFSAPAETPELVLAQWRALSRQVPLLYVMLVANTLILAATHYPVAPIELTVYIPGVLTVLCLGRTTAWWLGRGKSVSYKKARTGLRAMIWLGAALSLGFTAWSFALFPYGDAYQQSQIAFYMGITVIGCMFCLMHVRTAALVVGLCVIVPFTVFFVASGQTTLIAISVNMALVIAALLVILLGNNTDFAELVASRSAIAQRQEETQKVMEENHRLANIDSLTGVANRRAFERQLAQSLDAAQRAGETIAVVRIDIDNFKAVNEIFGQITGDEVLLRIAQRIDAAKRPDTMLARLDGDNFALILPEPADRAAQLACARMIGNVFAGSIDTPLGKVRVKASVGFASSTADDTPHTLFDRADYVTWVAKREARGSAMLFDESHAEELKKVRRMEHLLDTADLEQEIYILLQPQFDVSIGATTGFEVLARWRNPVLGEVSPADFIPMAERTGQICRITQTVLKKALAVSADLPRLLRLSVNLSAHDIGSPAAIEQIVTQVSSFGTPCRVDFEITETAVMHDLNQANQSLLALLRLGSRIALDDFGTGHSSLTHVQKLPLHRIKIDRSFVVEVTSDAASRAIVKTMVDLSRNLGISCVFEGIETEEQLEALVSLGGHVMQGYLFGRPMPVDKVGEYLAREQSLRNIETRAASA